MVLQEQAFVKAPHEETADSGSLQPIQLALCLEVRTVVCRLHTWLSGLFGTSPRTAEKSVTEYLQECNGANASDSILHSVETLRRKYGSNKGRVEVRTELPDTAQARVIDVRGTQPNFERGLLATEPQSTPPCGALVTAKPCQSVTVPGPSTVLSREALYIILGTASPDQKAAQLQITMRGNAESNANLSERPGMLDGPIGVSGRSGLISCTNSELKTF
ncbi:hypothetical protein OPT61_g2600 [Boeremia exigua]|uniref:Uncharacterized protein n=1 Tax=Boeremia exigua TaxID=749465 RepID=A0ACC2IL22_9PLEO|nr:hypothetical protein OPT61_g2600 [Boeremia exigua]